jgi:hypothetical protein
VARKTIDCRTAPNDVGCNSGHPATAAFLKELQAICTSEPQFRNLDVRSARTY